MKLSIFVTFAAQAMAMVPFSQIKFKRGNFFNEFVTPSSFFYAKDLRLWEIHLTLRKMTTTL